MITRLTWWSVFTREEKKRAHVSPASYSHLFPPPRHLQPSYTLLCFRLSQGCRYSRLPARGRNKKGSRRKYFDESPDAYKTFFSREFHSGRRVYFVQRGLEKNRGEGNACTEHTGPTQDGTRTTGTACQSYGIIPATYEHRFYTALLSLAKPRTAYLGSRDSSSATACFRYVATRFNGGISCSSGFTGSPVTLVHSNVIHPIPTRYRKTCPSEFLLYFFLCHDI